MAHKKKPARTRPPRRVSRDTSATGFSADHLAAIMDAALDAVVTMDSAGCITGWNRQAELIFGWPAAEAIGRTLAATVVPVRYRAAHTRGLAKFLDTGAGPYLGRRVELTAVHRTGREFPVELTVTPFRRGDHWHFTGFVRDVSGVRRAEQFLRQVIDADPNLIFVKDWEGRFTMVNRAAAEIYGTTVEEQVGKTDADYNPNREEVAHFLRDDRDVMFSGTPRFISEEPVRDARTGVSRWFQTIKVPLLSLGEESRQVLGVATDITERKRAEAIRETAYRISEAANTLLELPELFRAIHDSVRGLMPADNLYVAVIDPATGLLSFPYFVDQHEPPPAPRPMGRGLTEFVLRTGRSLLATTEVFDSLVARGEVDLMGAPSVDWVGVPLKSQGRTGRPLNISIAGLASVRLKLLDSWQ